MCAKRKDERDPDSGNTARGDDAQPNAEKTLETDAGKKSDPELIRGKVIGEKYEILSHLGSGAMGAVYKAIHTALNKEVAIKVLLTDALDDPVKKKRFMREAKAQGGLTHRNIVAVHDVGLTEKDQPYFVMDFLQGESLEEYIIKNQSLDCDQFINIFDQVARGIQHAHSKGIVHRDIKPSNIMLIDSEDGELHALVLDFGIAVHNDRAETKLTKAGYIVGTPCYMSPEQIEGKALDARSDIYSLGCVMFESLTGNLPFTGINAAATMALHLAQQPEHVSSFKTKSPLPEGLADLVMRCLEKDPTKRFSTAKEIAAQLNSLKKTPSKSEAEITLVGSVTGHTSKNPAHSPAQAAVVDKGDKNPEARSPAEKAGDKLPQTKTPDFKISEAKSADKVVLTEKEAEGKPAAEVAADKSKAKKKSVVDTGSSNEVTGGEGKLESDSESKPAMENHRKIDGIQLDTDSITIEKPESPTKSLPSFKTSDSDRAPIDGHDIIIYLIVGVFGIFIWPQNGRLALPISASEMRDDNPFFMLAKFIVEVYNHFANHPGWQFILWGAMLFLAYKVVDKLLKSGHTD